MNISQEHLRSSTSVDIGSEGHVYLKKKTVDYHMVWMIYYCKVLFYIRLHKYFNEKQKQNQKIQIN
jgi:hypothetical protein